MDNRLEIILAAKDVTGKAFASVQNQVASLAKSVFSLNTAFAAMAGAYGLGRIASGFLDTAREFERFEIQLETITGSSKKAKESMDWIAEFTKKTPYELSEVTSAFVKLEAYGLNGTRWLDTLGDTASSMGKGLNQAVEMFADAVTGEFERLKEFGVKTSSEGDTVTFKWSQNGKDMVLSTQKTASGISEALEKIFARFDGGMDKQSKTLDGMLSNLSDQFTMLQKTIMDAGIFEEVKVQVELITDQFSDWVEVNEELIKQKIPEYITDIKDIMETLVIVGGPVIWTMGQIHKIFSEVGPGSGLIQMVKIYKDIERYQENILRNQQKAKIEVTGKKIDSSIPGYDEFIKDKSIKVKLNTILDEVDSGPSKISKKKEKEIQKELESILKSIDDYGEKMADVHQAAQDELRKITTTTFDEEKYQLEKRLEAYREYGVDVVTIEEIKAAAIKDISKRETDDLNRRVQDQLNDILDEVESGFEKIEDDAESMSDTISNATMGWASNFSRELYDIMKDSESTWENILAGYLDMLGQMVLQKQVVEPLLEFSMKGLGNLGSMFGGGGSFDPFGMISFDTGGMVGSDGTKKPFPVIAHSGEVIGTPKQMAKLYGGGGSGITMHNTFNIESSGNDDMALVNNIVRQMENKVRLIINDEKRVGGSLNNSLSGGYV